MRLGTRGINCHQNGNHSRSLICVPFWVGIKTSREFELGLGSDRAVGMIGARVE